MERQHEDIDLVSESLVGLHHDIEGMTSFNSYF